jgi:hypothetical protein
MFIAVKDDDGIRVQAEQADKQLHYHCPLCGMPVVCKQGEKRVWHFAHTKGSDCDQDFKTPDMSEWHRLRQALFLSRCQEVTVVDRNTGEKHRADVMIYGKYVIEFQHSKISSEEFDRRNEFYTRCGYKVIWVFDLSDVADHLSAWYYQNTVYYKWKWPWRTWENCDFNQGDVILLIELEPHTKEELLQKPCWARVTTGVWHYDPDEFSLSEMDDYLMKQKSPPYTYYQLFSEFWVHKYELVNRMAFTTPKELDRLTSHCSECGRLIHKYKLKSSYGYYFKCYHGK